MRVNDLSALDWKEILNKLESFATSETARDRLSRLAPLAGPREAQASVVEIQEALSVLSHGERPFMESLDLFQSWFQRLKREAVLTTLDLKDVRRFCIEALALSEVIRPFRSPWVLQLKAGLMNAEEPLSAIDTIMTPEGDIRTDASETLHTLYREKGTQTRQLQVTLDKLVHKHQLENILQDKYVTTREGRWVLPVRGGMQHHFPGLIHASSQSKQTVFMEPEEVVPLNNRLRELDIQIDAEIERLLQSLSEYLFTQLGSFATSRDVLQMADIRFAQAKLSETLRAQACKFSENHIDLIDVRHPILALNTDKVIPNTVRMADNRRILLLSGPNAGGKTVLLKSVGLAAQMARCGLPICADETSTLPFFKNIKVGVGDAQSVDAHLSTFAAHLKILSEATECHGSHSLILIDEICGSTDPEEGSALARSFIQTYAENQVFGVITSHLGPLKVGWEAESGVINGSLEYNNNSGQPTYQFFMGIPGQSLALQTARRVGVKAEIIDRALGYLSPEMKMQHQHLREIESLKDELYDLRKTLQDETKEARDSKRKYHELIQRFRSDRDEWMNRTVKKAEKKIDSLIDFAQVDTLFKKHDKLQQIKQELPEVIKASTAAAPTLSRKLETAEDFEKIYPPGSKIFIPSIGQEGTVQGKANNKGEIPVLSNSMRLFIAWQQLKPPQSFTNPTAQIVRRSSNVTIGLRDTERVIDVRGHKSEEGIALLESQLDAAALNNEDRVKIVHGHGTEALKRAIRSHLSRSVYVKKWKAAGPDNGGDGVTWAELKD